ncbi:hypothetical protein MM213_18360 [Belliella sp. R4-6]|uniref:Peptidase family M23 n=1 Tax=Belliella alkalica TaxID=1730871 RepID=A0ABS9VHF9_9BACT|nr:hypothetical protein [Belliella alkalica]MCH7415470.1 hypothetical protein [Belliella alkalica]
MNKIICIVIFALYSPCIVNAQVNLYVKEERNGNKTFFSENKDAYHYSVIIDLEDFENLDTRDVSGRFFIAKPGKHPLAKMRVKNIGENTSLKYTSQIIKGKYNPEFRDKIPFLIPIREGLEVKITKEIYNQDVTNEDVDKRNAGVLIHFSEPTFICAPRKGLVTQINDGNLNESNEIDDEENFIELYHEDGTFSRLYVFKSKTSRINVGDVVFPGMELAESAVLNQQAESYVRLVRLITVKEGYNLIQKNEDVAFVSSINSSLKPENGFKMISVHPKKWITFEMSKKELKKVLPTL